MTETNVQKQIGAYISQYKYKIEMHAHSYPASGCSRLSPKEFIRALKSAGYDAVVLTNHFSVVDPFVRSEDDLRVYMQNFKDVQAEGDRTDRPAGSVSDQLRNACEAAGRDFVGNQKHIVCQSADKNTGDNLKP